MGLLNLTKPVEFEGVSPVTAVFYDDTCSHVISVRGGGVTGVVVRSMTNTSVLTHRLDTDTSIISIKLSPSHATLSVQKTANTVTFIPVSPGATSSSSEFSQVSNTNNEYTQVAKNKSCSVLGFIWLSNTEMVYVTDTGLELYNINQDKKNIKYVRSVSEHVAWYCHVSGNVILTSATAETDQVTVWSIRGGNIVKISTLSLGFRVRDKDVKMINVYDTLMICFNILQEASSGVKEIHVYSVVNEVITWTHVLSRVNSGGVIGLHTINNMIVVHSQSQSKSKFYDIQLTNQHPDHPQVLLVTPILPDTTMCSHDGAQVAYSANWVIFLPNILVDARNGKMWAVNLKLASNNLPSANDLDDINIVNNVKFLLNRENGKTPLMNLLKAAVKNQRSLPVLQEMFSCVVSAYTCHQTHVAASNHDVKSPPITCTSSVQTSPHSTSTSIPPAVILDQPDIFTNILNTFTSSDVPDTFLLSVVVEYIHSLMKSKIVPRQFIYELLINLCVRTNKLYQLQQYLQYQVILDSKPVACLLLSLESVYPSCRQMALDMMSRLGTAGQEIVEILLAQGQVVTALNYVVNEGGSDTASARKFLDAADACGDSMVFFNVFNFFEERNVKTRGNPNFPPSDQCEKFVKKFNDIFS